MRLTARDYLQRAEAANKRAVSAADISIAVAWLHLAQLWAFLAQFAMQAEGERLDGRE
jgi:hypothetical protein